MATNTVLLKVPVDDTHTEFVEVEVERRDVVEDSVELTADNGRQIGTATYSLASSLDHVLPAVRQVITKLRADEHAPDEISMELGLTIGGETGLFFAKGSAESTFTVTATWRKPNAT
ncbi:CU044_2847 family protein [Luedemannella helvata]|uniref:Trypsin-co-occurring domain-containing protein n=1 Tax=Luedemannella helvata TaxID=349315 RepID=A0ABP4VZ62_9ACTN